MELVVDANVLFSAFLKEAVTRECLMDSRLTLFAPEYLVTETSNHLKHDSSLRKRAGLSEPQFEELLGILTSGIHVVPAKMYESKLEEALKIAPHEEDSPYLALALKWNIPVWTNDKGFKKQDKVQIYNTYELVQFLK